MNNFYISYPGRLSNQLYLLYHIYNKYDEIDKVYAPNFDRYLHYFNVSDGDKFCDLDYFESNRSSFIEVDWEEKDIDSIKDFYDLRFNDLKPKEEFTKKVDNLARFMGDIPLIGVHIRLSDYEDFCGGKYFFPISRYLEETRKKRIDWKLKHCRILLFSDERLPKNLKGIVIGYMTSRNPVVDLFLLGKCNYFIHTWSTFSLFAIALSKSQGRFKDSFVLE